MATADESEMLVRAFKALAHPNRLTIYLTLLAQQEASLRSCSLSQLIDKLDIGAPTVSHHTRELVNAGLISVSRNGKFLQCRLDESMRERLAHFFDTPVVEEHSPLEGEPHASKT